MATLTFRNLNRLTDREIQILMREVDQKDLVVALKGATAVFKTKVLGNMSKGVRAFITEEMEYLGPIRAENQWWGVFKISSQWAKAGCW